MRLPLLTLSLLLYHPPGEPEALPAPKAVVWPAPGYYECQGRSGGVSYTNLVVLVRVGEEYRVTWVDAQSVVQGVGTVDDRDTPPRFVIGWSSEVEVEGKRILVRGVGSYRSEGPILSGVWAAYPGGDHGWEHWTFLRGLGKPPSPGL